MESSKDTLGEIKEKIGTVEVQLTYERKLLEKTTDLLTEDKDKWKEEIKAAEEQVKKTQKEIQDKEEWLKNCKKDLEVLDKTITAHEEENARLDQEILEEKKNQVYNAQVKEQEVGQLQENLDDLMSQLKMAASRCEYIRRQQEVEVNFLDETGEKKMKEWFLELSNAFHEREKELEEHIKDLQTTVRLKRKALWKLHDQVTALQLERDDLAKRNEKLKHQIELLES